MKLNPFSKKSGYLARIKAEYAEAQHKLDALKAQATEAQAEYEAKRKASREMEARGNHHLWTDGEVRLSRQADAAWQRVNELQREATELERECNRLHAIVAAPGKLEQARAAIIDLRHRRGVLQSERAQSVKAVAKLERRIGELEQRIAAETQAAGEAMAADDGDFTMSETLAKVDTELRIARTTLKNVTGKVQALDADIAAIPNQLWEAERAFKFHQSEVAEIELNEQLPNVLDTFARAAVSICTVNGYGRREDEYTISIPLDYVEAARAKLAAEMPGA
ncbi:hypothetical protein [Dokdonella sp.]|uniref:hypothetical protein n=1 Tax=Dokdonella sp. TaxID=2291710 RepID=UPI0025BA6681|nr:hypothetical protein [Dokdonella sp.]MBX3692675.1 hypothetical protein [Dokdonella sp.]MCW5567514.1 hypothetical protein [Dokdonella sp.]